uniref:Alpha-2-macroglobulin domain-containing protein n=1 Tax=Anopheles dirus TaxID=7168 RepID=A0A182NVA7_9DIPT
MFGVIQQWIPFNNALDMSDNQKNVQLKVTFIELLTNYTVSKETEITVYRYPYRVELLKNKSHFQPGLLFKCALQVRYLDGSPAVGISGEVDVKQLKYEKNVVSDDKGLIELELPIDRFIELMDIEFTGANDGFFFFERVKKTEATANTFLNLKIKSDYSFRSTKRIDLEVTSNNQIQFLAYYVVAREEIIQWDFVKMTKNTKQHIHYIHVSEKMLVPRAKIVVITVSQDSGFVWDSINMDFSPINNQLDMIVNENKPGHEVEVVLRGRPGSYVGLASYSQRFQEFAENHAIFVEDAKKLLNSLYINGAIDDTSFHSTGLFVRTESYTVLALRSNFHTSEYCANEPDNNNNVYRSSFVESWLWKSVTIGKSGTHTLIDILPNTSTIWNLTGFSIDPTFGLSIMKDPIQITTVPLFYIVDNLSYFIKREEEAELKFNVFSNHEKEIMVDVTLYNVANQIVFVERPDVDESYTKSVSVLPNVGVPVSFLVKARKLGEMIVRVKASTMLGLQTDAIEKVIRVLPESLVQQKVETRMFCSNETTRKLYTFNLNISDKRVEHSEKIAFRLNPNILTNVIQNLDKLIKLPTGCGEQNMIKFVPNIIALDYLTAMISTNTSFEKSIKQATDFLREGYQNQMGYRKKDGSFSVFHSEDGSVFLTAFVAKSMQAASKYIDIDESMIDKACAWLASKQDRTGRFDEVGYIFDKEIQGGLRNGIALTSYVLVALLEHPELKTKYEQIVRKGLNYLDSKFSSIDNAYDLSLATYAFMLSDHSHRNQALDKLIAMSTFVRKTDERYWNTTNTIEATAYALLSFVKANKYQEAIPVMHWLLNQRSETGSFGGTQNTFVGLQALTTFAKNICPFQNEYSADLLLNKKFHEKFRMNTDDISIQNFNGIEPDIRILEVDVQGHGFGLLEVIYEYTMNLQNFSHRFDLSLQKQNTGSDYAMQLIVCASFIPIGTDTRSNMALVEVNFPSGYVAEQNPISQATKGNPIQNIELRFGGAAVVVYYMNMGPDKNCFTVTAYKRFKVALIHSAFVTVYDYYDPDLNAVKVYDI